MHNQYPHSSTDSQSRATTGYFYVKATDSFLKKSLGSAKEKINSN